MPSESLEATRAAAEHWIATRGDPPRGLALVVGSDPARLARFLDGFAGTSRRRVRLGAAFAAELTRCDPDRLRTEAFEALERALPAGGDVLLVDRIEALFLRDFELSVLEALRRLAHDRALLVAWPLPSPEACSDLASSRLLHYATEGHPEHVRAAVGDLPVWPVE